MDIPETLREALRRATVETPDAQIVEDARRISRRYRDRTASARFIQSRSEALAYAVTRMPATSGAVSSALDYALERQGRQIKSLRSLLDVGAGTGAASWAADAQLDLDEVTCIEQEEWMRQIGNAMMADGSDVLQGARWISCNIAADPIPCQADLVVASYILNELDPRIQAAAAEKLWASAGELLLIVEPGTPEGYGTICRARDALLRLGAHIAAPCPHERPCPMTEQDWCHFTCRIPRSQLHRLSKGGDVPYEDEKFSYMALTRTPCPKSGGGRILRRPWIAKGFVRIELCAGDGLVQTTLSKKDGEAYKRARKAKCGDWIELQNNAGERS